MAKITPEEHELHQRLRAAHERNLITIYTDSKILNTSKSPVFNPWEAMGPLLGLLMIALFVLLLGGLIAGTVAMVLSVALFAVGIKPWLDHRLRHRAIITLMCDARTLNMLWSFGGVGLALAGQPQTVVAAPKGNWRNFVRRYLPDSDHVPLDEELAGADFSTDRRRAEDTATGLEGNP